MTSSRWGRKRPQTPVAGATSSLERLCGTLSAALEEALAELDPARLVEGALPPRPPRNARVYVIAAGKASVSMTRGAYARWGRGIAGALVVTVDGVVSGDMGDSVTVRRAGHPVPDARSVEATTDALARAQGLGERDLLLALVSGGASSLLAAPPPGVSLREKSALVGRLLESGATIAEVNVVRRHFSSIKGGRLALAAHPARVLTLILADIVRPEAYDVGSGPTVADPTTVADARDVLARRVPDAVDVALVESSKPGIGPRARLRHRILATPDDLAEALAARLARAGLRARALRGDEGDATAIARRRVELARALQPGEAVVVACEPTLALPPERGRGGRAGWVALAAMGELPEDVALLCAASDGVDGTSGTGGALVTRADAERTSDAEIRAALASFDDARVHAALGTALVGGPTGTNLTDVHVLARASSA